MAGCWLLLLTVSANEIEVPDRTLTFESYYSDPFFRNVTPVYVSEVDVVSVINDKLVDFWDRTVLEPDGGGTIQSIWKRKRACGAPWEQLTDGHAGLFSFTVQNDQVALVVDLTALSDIYEALGSTGVANYYHEDDTVTPFPTLDKTARKLVMSKQSKRLHAEKAKRANEETEARKEANRHLRNLQAQGVNTTTGISYDKVGREGKREGEERLGAEALCMLLSMAQILGRFSHQVGEQQREGEAGRLA